MATFLNYLSTIFGVVYLFIGCYLLFSKLPSHAIFSRYRRSRQLYGAAFSTTSIHLFLSNALYALHVAPHYHLALNVAGIYIAAYLFGEAAFHWLDRTESTDNRTKIYGFGAGGAVALGTGFMLTNNSLLQSAGEVIGVLGLLFGLGTIMYYITKLRRDMLNVIGNSKADKLKSFINALARCLMMVVIYAFLCVIAFYTPPMVQAVMLILSIVLYIYMFVCVHNYIWIFEEIEQSFRHIFSVEDAPQGQQAEKTVLKTMHPTAGKIPEDRLQAWIDDEGYTQSDITIEQVAAHLGTNRSYLSSFINTIYQQSFSEWLCHLRIDYAKKQMLANPNHSLESIALSSGFSSGSYFNKVFTKYEKISPAKWKMATQAQEEQQQAIS